MKTTPPYSLQLQPDELRHNKYAPFCLWQRNFLILGGIITSALQIWQLTAGSGISYFLTAIVVLSLAFSVVYHRIYKRMVNYKETGKDIEFLALQYASPLWPFGLLYKIPLQKLFVRRG